MKIICDTHVPIFYQDDPNRLSDLARRTFEQGMCEDRLALADISLWEIAMLFARGRLNPRAPTTPAHYIRDLLIGYGLEVLPIEADIAVTAQSDLFTHGDPADRLIGATAIVHRVPLLTIDEKLQAVPGLKTIW
jgi:PIN domain nuclease of toxin-antitoxin system